MSLTSGINVSELDPRTRPQDDLYRHVNGKWMERTEIPADRARYGAFTMLQEEAEHAVREIIEEAADAATAGEATDEQRKIGDLYASFMDTERIEALGADPIRPDLALALSPKSIEEVVLVCGELERSGLGGFYQLFIDNDPGQPDRYVTFLMQGGISLPDESYYREDAFAQVRQAYVAHVERMFDLAGVSDAAHRAKLVFALERDIATSHWDVVASRDIQKMYNLRTLAQLQELTPQIDWAAYLRAADVPERVVAELVVAQPDAIAGLAELLVPERLEAWRAWLAWQVINGSASLLSAPFVDEHFAFYGTILSGTPKIRERWKRGVSLVQGGLGEAVGKLYVERHFDHEAKRRMDALVANLIEAYRVSIGELTWMGEETRRRALEKLDKFTPKIGYPVKWRDYSSLKIERGDLIANSRAVAKFQQDRELAKIGKPIDRDEWFMTPQTINAYYNPGFNEIVFPAAILQPPFFDQRADDAANYGGIGGVIGHEIGHGFDDQGSKYDGDGALVDWWTDADRAAFEQLTSKLIDQYDALEPAEAPGHHVNGALTIGENIGDLGGLGIAWKAYLLSLDGQEPPVIDGMTGAQRFLLAWAQVWQEKRRPEEAVRLLSIDPHSPDEFRCNQIARNLQVFYDAFDVRPGDGMWLDEADRVVIW